MVDDTEFIKRRHLSRGRPRKYEIGTTADFVATAEQNSAVYLDANSKSGQNTVGKPARVASTLSDSQNRKTTKSTKKKATLRSQFHQNECQQQMMQQQQRYSGESMHFNRKTSDNLTLPSFGIGLSQSTSSVHAYALHHHPTDRYLNSGHGTEFEFGMTLY